MSKTHNLWVRALSKPPFTPIPPPCVVLRSFFDSEKMTFLDFFDMYLIIFDIISQYFVIFVTIWPLFVHYLLTICPLFAHYLLTICPLFAHYLLTIPDPNAENNFPSLGTQLCVSHWATVAECPLYAITMFRFALMGPFCITHRCIPCQFSVALVYHECTITIVY